MKHTTFLLVALAMMGCQKYEKPIFSSVDEYPVKKSSAVEVNYKSNHTSFSVWAPAADSVRVLIYQEAEGGDPTEVFLLEPKNDGSWNGRIKGDLKGLFYTFQIYQDNQWLAETPGIFAQAVGINGKRGAIIRMKDTNPEGWDKDERPAFHNLNDAIVYELHWRDFSADPSGGFANPGKYLCLTEEGTLSPEGLSTGIDHLKELGVTHIHIMPSYDFGSIDEHGTESEAIVLESGAAAGGKYNWGYDPVNYNVPEGSYSTNAADPTCRIREFKQMVMACHKAGIRVVMDVVFNHTYDVASSGFSLTAPGYFYRTREDGSLANGSGCGNETASNRPMMRKFMLESCKYWLEEYHLDGFRFDLMGIHDIQTMNEIRHMADKIDKNILIYGEGWAAESPQLPFEQLAMRENAQQLDRIAIFSDVIRDGLRGPFWSDTVGAFLAGKPDKEEDIKFGIVGSIDYPDIDFNKIGGASAAWTNHPAQQIAYVSCHDDMCLVDRLHASAGATSGEEVARLDKLAQTAVLTSQGIPFIFCGEEVMRDKKGVHNSFCSPDSINDIRWENKALHKDVFDYYRGLIAMRKAHPAFRMGNAELVRKHLHFLPVEGSNLIAFYLDGKAVNDSWDEIIVVLNGRREEATLNIPAGEYTAATADGIWGTEMAVNILNDSFLTIAPQSAMILHK